MSLPFYIRNLRHVRAALPVLLLACVLAVPAPASAARPDRCRVSGAETLLVTRDARIYKTTRTRASGGWTDTVSVCLKRDGDRFRLSRRESDGVNESGSRAIHLRRVGRSLGYVYVREGRATRRVRARIVDLRHGLVLRDYRLGDGITVTDFEAGPSAMAWIEKQQASDENGSVHMYAGRSEIRLDGVASADLESLTARNGSVFWTDGGERRSAAFRRLRGPEGRCRPPGSTAVLTAKAVRVFKITRIERSGEKTLVYHCVRRTGKRTELSRVTFDGIYAGGNEAVLFRRVGPQFAYVLESIDTYSSKYDYDVPGPNLRFADLQTGRVVRDHKLPDNTHVTGFVARPGAMAWIQGSVTFPPYEWAVHRLAGDTDTRLDSGESLDAGSLSTDGTTIFWTDNGGLRSAPFG